MTQIASLNFVIPSSSPLFLFAYCVYNFYYVGVLFLISYAYSLLFMFALEYHISSSHDYRTVCLFAVFSVICEAWSEFVTVANIRLHTMHSTFSRTAVKKNTVKSQQQAFSLKKNLISVK